MGTTGIIVKEDMPAYLGILLNINKKTSFLNAIGSLNSYRTIKALDFNMSQGYSLDAANDDAVSEDASIAALSPTGQAATPQVQTAEIRRYDVAVSNVKQNTPYETTGNSTASQDGMIVDLLAEQKQIKLFQFAVNLEYNMLNGTRVAYSAAATASKMNGILTACTTNTCAAGGTALSKTHIKEVIGEIATNGLFQNIWVLGGAFQLEALNDLYAFQPPSFDTGGINIREIITPLGNLKVLLVPGMPAATLAFVDMDFVKPAFLPIGGEVIKWFDIPLPGAVGGYFESIASIDYTNEKLHGTITGLATS